jgi:hypothetical protein
VGLLVVFVLVEQVGDGVVAAVGGEVPGQPGVQGADGQVLAQDHVQRVVDGVGQGVLGRVAAAVVATPRACWACILRPQIPQRTRLLSGVPQSGVRQGPWPIG